MPEEVMALFKRTVPSGLRFGTVTVYLDGEAVEVTTFRREGRYGPDRRPQEVRLGVTLEEDLSRRDFTVNALAYDPVKNSWIDCYGVKHRLAAKYLEIKAVGSAKERFEEDPLRMLRAFYLMARAGAAGARFAWDEDTFAAISSCRDKIKGVSGERIREELNKILLGPNPAACLAKMEEAGLLEIILPELTANKGVDQGNRFHRLDVLEHILATVQLVEPRLALRWAALLHDIGKYRCRIEVGDRFLFYGHAPVSAEMASAVLGRLKFGKELQNQILNLIAHHMFDYPQTEAGIRRLLRRVGPENIDDLLELRRADILASGPNATTRAVENLRRQIREVQNKKPGLTLKDLAVNGFDVMEHLKIKPGPRVGQALNYLLERVLDEPSLNERQALLAELDRWALSQGVVSGPVGTSSSR
ncbi:MAG: hypothetical protein PWP65_1535 [Clostridia bacterium]|nr:hypothetical protein [Clostridia bacterium]